jgi:hypothetical protein
MQIRQIHLRIIFWRLPVNWLYRLRRIKGHKAGFPEALESQNPRLPEMETGFQTIFCSWVNVVAFFGKVARILKRVGGLCCEISHRLALSLQNKMATMIKSRNFRDTNRSLNFWTFSIPISFRTNKQRSIFESFGLYVLRSGFVREQ